MPEPQRQPADVYDAAQPDLRLSPDGTPRLGIPVLLGDLDLRGLTQNFWQAVPGDGMTARKILDRAKRAPGVRSAFILQALRLLDDAQYEAAEKGFIAGQKPTIGEPIYIDAIDQGRATLPPELRHAYDTAFYWALANAAARGVQLEAFALDASAIVAWEVAEALIKAPSLRSLTPERIAVELKTDATTATEGISIALQALSGH